MKVLEDLPITLTSPRIWEALGLPLTPFEDTIDFFNNPSAVTEESVRPFVAMKAQLYDYHTGNAVTDSHGDPVIGFGTAPIDIPNCERCHSNAPGTPNSPNSAGEQWNLVQQEASYWAGQLGGSADEWYPRLKSAAVSMLYAHDVEHGTGFMDCYPFPDNVGAPGCDDIGQDTTSAFLQTTRLGKESVICQKCHADNVIAVVKSAYADAELTRLIPSVTDAIHHNHRSDSELVLTGVACDTNADCDTAAGEVCGTAANNLGICGIPGPIAFSDSHGRDGGCQGCHPAHRSDGDLEGYPITLQGTNFYADGDNRLANGGCFVGRDVHSNPMKDLDAGTPSHLNAVGQWLVDNVTNDQGDWRGIWCTNCHTQLSQEMWKAENCADLVHGDCISNPRAEPTLAAVAAAVGTTPEQAASWLDPKSTDPNGDFTHAIWEPDPGLCAHAASLLGLADPLPAMDANVATIEINLISAANCTTPDALDGPDCFGTGSPAFYICGTKDEDGDFNVALKAAGGNSPFCTTPDCVAAAQGTLDGGFHYDGDPSPDTLVAEGQGQLAIPAPFSAATDGRDHWLAAGEPHCADCHEAPYVEQSGNLNAFAPFNYPRKASLMRYSRGHQDITCQGCHESIHGLYPVTPTIDTTSYAQAASLNHDGSHGPLKCGTCHEVGSDGLPTRIDDLQYNGQRIKSIDDPDERFDAVVSWAHTFTMEHDPTRDYCVNCHGDESREVSWREEEWLEHSMEGRVPRKIMDRVEIQEQGFISGDPEAGQDPLRTVCQGCHGDERDEISCNGEDGREWKEHLTEGRVAEKVWVSVSESSRRTGNTTCGW
jgi:mono/diheme cytochrome c family protein